MGPAQEEWCEFYKTRGHAIEECRLLKCQIEKLIQENHLGWFVVRREDDRRPALKGGSMVEMLSATRKRYSRSVLAIQERPSPRQDLSITFFDEDYEYIIPTLMTLWLSHYKVEWMLVDQGSSANVLF
ncbi:hypothetical protein CR513_03683, partial [Mucuna pruriens]